MKNDVMPSIVQMDKDDLHKLTAEVKETVARGIELSGLEQKSFGVVDMWKILKNARSANDIMRRS
jgi:hypothetical protein